MHSFGNNSVLAMCDKEVRGKALSKGDVTILVSEKFYGTEEISELEARRLLHEFENINLMGNKVVQIALEEKVLSPESAINISGVRHAQIFKI
ncbi:MAG: DUF424 family protein [Candidatus Diapherotrites archaeon]|nr:DUF424 family protein [Candidatus Diapherotrites archaeon]